MGEAQYRYNQDKDATGLAGSWKLGFWHHFGQFESLRFDTLRPLARQSAQQRNSWAPLGTSGIYGVVDHQLYRPPGGGPDSGITMFSRVGASAPDRNPVEFYWDGGLISTACCRAGRTTSSARRLSMPRIAVRRGARS